MNTKKKKNYDWFSIWLRVKKISLTKYTNYTLVKNATRKCRKCHRNKLKIALSSVEFINVVVVVKSWARGDFFIFAVHDFVFFTIISIISNNLTFHSFINMINVISGLIFVCGDLLRNETSKREKNAFVTFFEFDAYATPLRIVRCNCTYTFLSFGKALSSYICSIF